ncbi:hypothetical protein NPIRD3C_0565 [Nitrosopumilus piranensis]|uniref:Uncharacterized protein n=1 Tax=Nitrosopumilus piranensis TaxID=1582439 RepID=A0A0C5BUA8_9ARCH|nr:hypothetical protein NPIRD3C_0565 [Nitrosopumilus piranensis]
MFESPSSLKFPHLLLHIKAIFLKQNSGYELIMKINSKVSVLILNNVSTKICI